VLLFSCFILKNIAPKGQASNALVCGNIVARTTVAFTPAFYTPKFDFLHSILPKSISNILLKAFSMPLNFKKNKPSIKLFI
jgi:hypothetical protein